MQGILQGILKGTEGLLQLRTDLKISSFIFKMKLILFLVFGLEGTFKYREWNDKCWHENMNKKKQNKKQQSRFDSAAINFKGESKVGQLNSCNDND